MSGSRNATATQASELGVTLRGADLRPIRSLPWLSAEGDLQRRYLGFASVDQARLAIRAAP